MPRIVFSIMGKRVQNVGYRLFLLQAMKERKLDGFVVNQGDKTTVRIEVWGTRTNLLDFYKYVESQKPARAGGVIVTQKIIDLGPKPSRNILFNEKMDLIVEQTGKFVQEGVEINKTLKSMDSKMTVLVKK